MESSVLLSNFALTMCKEFLDTEKNSDPLRSFYPPLFHRASDSDDDEAERFYFQRRQQQQMQHQEEERASRQPTPNSREPIWPGFLNQFDEETFENFLHMSKSSFLNLFDSTRSLMLKRHFSSTLTMQSVFSLAIWKICRDEHFEEIGRRFDVPFMECQTAIRLFWKVISHNEARFIKWPKKSDLMNDNLSRPKAIGVIALKRLDIFLESSDQEAQVIWQIVCNAEGKILDCFVQTLPDYDFDSTPLGNSLHKKSSNTKIYLVGDKNFPLRKYLINPFPTPSNERETKFNRALESRLKFAQNIFENMAKRFNTVYALESRDLFEVRRIISTICCLHNLCVDINDDYVEREQETTKSVNWSKPVQMEYRYEQPSEDVLNFRKTLIDGVLENPIF